MGARTLVTILALTTGLAAAEPVLPGAPAVSSVLPRGGQRGTEVTLDIRGARLNDARGLFLYRPGIEVLSVESKTGRRVLVRIAIAADCPLGEHPLHLRTAHGISGLRSFRVGVLPEISEKEPNDVPDAAQEIPFDVTVNGNIRLEDRDVYAVNLPRGRVSIEVCGLRLGDVDCDPLLVLRAPDGSIRATSEDTTLGVMDPYLVVQNAEPGRYLIEVRETAWGGSARHHYRLHVGDFPRPAGALPTGVATGGKAGLSYVGPGGGFRSEVTFPAGGTSLIQHFPRDARGVSPTPILLARSSLKEIVEPADHGSRPVPCTVPCALSGVLSKRGERDRWTFEAKRRRRVSITVQARALRSPLDAFIAILDPRGRYVTGNDDSGGPDGRINFNPPADGKYTLVVRDHLLRGGPSFFYRITMGAPGGGTRTRVFTPRNGTPTWVSVPRGGRMACVVAVERSPADAVLQLDDVPFGVTQAARPKHPASSLVPVVLGAPADAPIEGSLGRLNMSVEDGEASSAGFRQSVVLVRVENNRVYLRTTVDRIPVAVTERLPFRIDCEQPTVPVVRGSGLTLKVRVIRDEGFTGPVRLRLLHNPPGIRSGTATVAGNRDVGHIAINQSGPPSRGRPWSVVVVGSSTVGGGPVETCSDLVDLNVVSPYFIVSAGKARATQGEDVSLEVGLRPRTPFIGKVKLEVPNLPRGVKVEIPELDEKSTKAVLKLQIAKNAPPGRHRGLLFRFRVPTKGGIAIQQVRGGELRIDKPRPATKARPVAAPRKPPGTKKRAWGTVGNPKT